MKRIARRDLFSIYNLPLSTFPAMCHRLAKSRKLLWCSARGDTNNNFRLPRSSSPSKTCRAVSCIHDYPTCTTPLVRHRSCFPHLSVQLHPTTYEPPRNSTERQSFFSRAEPRHAFPAKRLLQPIRVQPLWEEEKALPHVQGLPQCLNRLRLTPIRTATPKVSEPPPTRAGNERNTKHPHATPVTARRKWISPAR